MAGGNSGKDFLKSLLFLVFFPVQLLHSFAQVSLASKVSCNLLTHLTLSYSTYTLGRWPKIAVLCTHEGRGIEKSKQGNYK